MIPSLLSKPRQWLQNWFDRRVKPETGPVVLVGRRIYIMPDRHGMLFGGLFMVMLLGAMNENLNLALTISALLVSVLFVSILHTYRNLHHLRVSVAPAKPVFVGEHAQFSIALRDDQGVDRFAIGLQPGRDAALRNETTDLADVRAGGVAHLPLVRLAERRGWLPADRFTLFTRYPLGLIHAWSHLQLRGACLVYPRPESGNIPLPHAPGGREAGERHGEEGDDFIGLRAYRPEDSPRHVHWKASARREKLLTKQFGGEPPPQIWLEWNQLQGMGVEARLSRLCRWVLDAQRQELFYGLRLPGVVHPPARGEVHCQRCLQALALHGAD